MPVAIAIVAALFAAAGPAAPAATTAPGPAPSSPGKASGPPSPPGNAPAAAPSPPGKAPAPAPPSPPGKAPAPPAAQPSLPAPAPPAPAEPSPAPVTAAVPTASAEAPPAPPSDDPAARLAVEEFTLEGEAGSAALALQLEDGFLVGLGGAGLSVLDSAEVARRMAATPELQRCENTLCLRRLGQILGVRHVLRTRVGAAGNGYRAVARLLSAVSTAPAVVPVETQSRFCDVCTVAEARDMMIRLGEAIRRPVEASLRPASPPPPPPSPLGRAARIAAATGAASALGGVVLLAASGGDSRGTAAAGGLIGAGLALAGASLYVLIAIRRPQAAPRPSVAALR